MPDTSPRLMLVTDSYPPFIGGADRQVQMIAQGMAERGYEVLVVTPWQPGLPVTQQDDGVRVVRVRPLTTRVPWFSRDSQRRHHPPFPDPGTWWELRRLIARWRPDVVHSYGWITWSVAAALRTTDIPFVMSARDYGSFCSVRNLLYYKGRICDGPALGKCLRCAAYTYSQDEAGNAVLGGRDREISDRHRLRGAGKGLAAVAAVLGGRRLLSRRLDGLHSNSSFVQMSVRRHLLAGMSRNALLVDEVIPSFLPPDSLGPVDEAALAQLPSEPYILFVGALLPQKGIWPLLAAYARLSRPAPPLVLLGPSFQNSPSAVPPGAVIAPPVDQATVLAAWQNALFGVVPSVGAETFGNVITEAMSQGRTVVASHVGGIVDIVDDGESGLLVPPGDVEALRAAMQRLVDDPILRERLAARTRARVQRFHLDAVLPRFDSMYRGLMMESRSTGNRPLRRRRNEHGGRG